jgi:hypothetical protein
MIIPEHIQNMIKKIRKLQWISLTAMWAGVEKPSEAAIVLSAAISGMRADHASKTELGLEDLAILLEPLLQEGLILFNSTKVLEDYDGSATPIGNDLRSGPDLFV